MRRSRVLAATAVLAATLSACGSDPPSGAPSATTDPPTTGAPSPAGVGDVNEEAPAEPPTSATDPPDSRAPGTPPPLDRSIDPALRPAVERVRAELAAELGIEAARVGVVDAEFVVWPDGSLGCPRPGQAYPQVQVDGVRIVLEANGVTYSYHGGADVDLFLCSTPTEPPAGSAPAGDS